MHKLYKSTDKEKNKQTNYQHHLHAAVTNISSLTQSDDQPQSTRPTSGKTNHYPHFPSGFLFVCLSLPIHIADFLASASSFFSSSLTLAPLPPTPAPAATFDFANFGGSFFFDGASADVSFSAAPPAAEAAPAVALI